MGIFSFIKNQHIESIEWTEPDAQTIVYSFPTENKLIKMGAQLTVRESQSAVFVCDGKVADVFGPGRYVLSAEKLPSLAALQTWKYGQQSPFKASVYFVNTKQFHEVKWNTANPIVMEDAELGPVRFKAAGKYTYKVSDAEQFMKEIFATNQIYDTAYLLGQQKSMLNAGLTEIAAEAEIPAEELDLRKGELGKLASSRLQNRFARLGVELSDYSIDTIALSDEAIAAIEERARQRELEEEARLKAIEEEEARLREEEAAVQLAEEEAARLREEAAAGEAGELAAEDSEALSCASCDYVLEKLMKFCPECGAKI